MRAMRKVVLSWSLVSIPCKVYKATDEQASPFKQVHTVDGGRIRMRRYCESCNEDVEFSEISKGFQNGDSMVTLTDDDMAALPLESSRELSVQQFVGIEEIDPILTNGDHYYLGPDIGGEKSYMLLTDALSKSGKVAVIKVALGNRERIAVIRPTDGVMIMSLMSWPEEIRNSAEVPFKDTPKIDDKEAELALQLIAALTKPFEPEEYADEYQAALTKLVTTKTGDPVAGVATPAHPKARVQPSMEDALTAALTAVQPKRGRKAK